jgi:Zn finger protein HypA/HybF involved in hydrogenase expression
MTFWAKRPPLTEESGTTLVCKTCRTQFIIPENETAACCPICRMNRIRPVEDR